MAEIVEVRAYSLAVKGEEAYLGQLPSGEHPPEGEYFLRPPWHSLYSGAFETLLVRVEVDSGEVGWGEALAPVAPEVLSEIVERLLKPTLIGREPRDVTVLQTLMSGMMRERGHLVGHQADALAAVDMALWDLKGRLCGESVARLLGGVFRKNIPAYVSGLPRPTNEERAELAREWVSRGWTHVKLALGYGIDEDLETFDAITAVDPDLRLAIDAHWAYSLSEALRLGRGLDARKAWFFEAPLAPEDEEGHGELASALDTPVAIGEALRNPYEFRNWISRRAVDLCQPDVARTGITECMAICGYARVHHLPVALHHSVGLGVSLAAGLQVSAALANLLRFEYQPTTLEIANRILTTPLEAGAGNLVLPSGAGLGVEVDEKTVEQYARRVSA